MKTGEHLDVTEKEANLLERNMSEKSAEVSREDDMMPFKCENNAFICIKCDKEYNQLVSLKKHMENNHNLFDYIMFVCKKMQKGVGLTEKT